MSTAVKERIKTYAPRIFIQFVCFSFGFTTSAFTYSSSTPIILGHYLTVTTTILFVFSLRFSNDIFSYDSSLLW
jgi:hypothetical protein